MASLKTILPFLRRVHPGVPPPQHEYRPLVKERKEIRLVRINGGVSNTSESFCCSITYALLCDPTRFTALSYTWGDPTDRVPIILDGAVFLVTRNLRTALRYLYKELGGSLVWIDAICINQFDDEEKSWKVEMMSAIYATAERVLVWLGPAAGRSDYLMDKLETLGEEAVRRGIGLLSEDDISDVRTSVANVVAGQERLPSDDSIEALIASFSLNDTQESNLPLQPLLELMGQPWWQRVWVVQELTVARRAVIACGAKRIPVEILDAALKVALCFWHATIVLMARFADLDIIPNIFSAKPRRLLPNILLGDKHPFINASQFQLVHRTEYAKRKLSLKSLLLFVSSPDLGDGLQCTNPRDMVFALLGLSNDAAELGIKPDYTQTCASVFTQVAKAILNKGKSLDLLSYCRPTDLLGLLSWAPDWNVRPRFISPMYAKPLNDIPARYFDSCMPLRDQEKLWDTVEPLILHISALVVGRVTRTLDTMPGWQSDVPVVDDMEESYCDARAWFKSVLDFVNDPYPLYTTREQAISGIISTIFVDQVLSPNAYLIRMERDQKAEFVSCFRKILDCYTFKQFEPWLGYRMTKKIGPDATAEAVIAIIDDFSRANNIDPFILHARDHDSDSDSEVSPKFEPYDVEGHFLARFENPAMRIAHAINRAVDLKYPDCTTPPEDLETMYKFPGGFKAYNEDLGGMIAKRTMSIIEQRRQVSNSGLPSTRETHNVVVFGSLIKYTQLTVDRRKLFRVRGANDEFLCLGPCAVEAGDVVVIAQGADVPFLLRSTNETSYYRLLGECYVHGIMDGEFVEGKCDEDFGFFKIR